MIIEEFNRRQLGILTQLMSDETYIVKKMFLSSMKDELDVFYVFYEETKEQLIKEKEEINKLDKIAQDLENDKDYMRLKNSTQRNLYLLSEYNVPSGQATKVIELLNIKKILREK